MYLHSWVRISKIVVQLNRHRRFTFPLVNDILFPGRQLALNYQLMAAIIYIVMATSGTESLVRKQFVFFYKLGCVMIVLIKNALTYILIWNDGRQALVPMWSVWLTKNTKLSKTIRNSITMTSVWLQYTRSVRKIRILFGPYNFVLEGLQIMTTVECSRNFASCC